ncbi:hypothetical protein HX021_21460 [Sphingobacterium sp. N143]|uniref:hypothetical protein n=1 Tax=Sphingobacterium sp. N143 TaxID=2746727 RepID=UPI002575BFD7|nr:hypothetical protein [Sphingobacterium sp. N143]MDM1296861.1 hypothetical protein [Sphingobacterium sp. N143]
MGFVIVNVYVVYSGLAAETASTMGLTSSAITSANYTMIVGMAITFPVILRIKMILRSTDKLFWGCLLMAFISFISIYNSDYYLLLFLSFLMGIIKMNCLFEFILLFMGLIITKTGNKARFYAIFYGILYSLVALGTFTVLYISFGYQWERTSLFFTIALLFCAILSKVTTHNSRFSRYYPFYYIDWFSALLLVAGFLILAHFFAYITEYNWLIGDRNGFPLLLLSILLISGGILRQQKLERPFWNLSSMKKRSVHIAAIFLFFTGIYQGANAFDTLLMSSYLGYSTLQIGWVTLWMIPGSSLGGLLGWFVLKNTKNLKTFVFCGFLIFACNYLYGYFFINHQLTIEYFYLTHFLKSLAIGMLYIGLWHYLTYNLSLDESLSVMSLMLIIRTFLAVAFFGSIYTFLNYFFQKQSIDYQAVLLDRNIFGKNNMQKYSTAQAQAILVGIKKIYGLILIISVPLLIAILAHGFGYSNRRKKVRIRKFSRNATAFLFNRMKKIITTT